MGEGCNKIIWIIDNGSMWCGDEYEFTKEVWCLIGASVILQCDQNFMVGRYRLRSSKTSSCNGGDDVLSVILYVTFSWTRSDPLETRKPPQCNMQPTKPSYHFSFSLPGTRIIGLLGLIVFSNAADMNTWRNAIQIQRTTGSWGWGVQFRTTIGALLVKTH